MIAESGGHRDSVLITITDPFPPGPVETITLSPSAQTVNAGDSLSVYAEAKDAQARRVTAPGIAWTSSDATVVSIEVQYETLEMPPRYLVLLRARKAGTATITATANGRSGTASVTVR